MESFGVAGKARAVWTCFRTALAPLLVALSLSVTVAHQAVKVAENDPERDSVHTWAYATQSGTEAGQGSLIPNWQARRLSLVSAGWAFRQAVVRLDDGRIQIRVATLKACIGKWYFGWMLAVCLALSLLRGVSPVAAMLAAFAMMQFGLIVLPQARAYPWDMPALCFATLAIVGWTWKRLWLVIPVLLVGTGFKESLAVFSLLLLFWPLPSWRSRLAWFALGAVGCVLVRFACLGRLATPEVVVAGHWVGIANLRHLAFMGGYGTPLSQNAWLATGGLMLPFLLSFRYRDGGWWTGVALWVLLAVTGIVIEYRIFYEMIPLIVVWLLHRNEVPGLPVRTRNP